MATELDYLVLAAHPDDAELFCGGLLLKMRARGYRVGVLDFTRGEAATHGSVPERERETAAADRLLQPHFRTNLGLPDGHLRDDEATRQLVVDVIRTHRVKVLVAPPDNCRHPDHTAVHRVARSAHFFAGAGGFASTLPRWRPHRLLYHLEYAESTPSFVVDISEVYAAREALVACYPSQFFTGGTDAKETVIGGKQFMHKMRARFAHYGALIGREYGEPYLLDETLRIDDPLKHYLEG